MMNTPAEKIEEFGKLCEDIYAWFLKEMGKPADFDLWHGRKATFWVLKDKKVKDAWLKAWRAKLGLDQIDFDYFLKGSNFYSGTARRASSSRTTEDIRNTPHPRHRPLHDPRLLARAAGNARLARTRPGATTAST